MTTHESTQGNTVTIDNPDNLTEGDYKAPDTVAGATVASGNTSENTVNIKGKYR